MEKEANSNEKSIIKIIWIISLLVLIIQVLIERFLNLKLLVFSVDANLIKLLLILFLFFSPIFFLNFNKFKMRKIIYIIFVIIFTIYSSFIYMVCYSADAYYYSDSPYENSNRELIVEESSVLGSGEGHFYERKYMIFIKKLDGGIVYNFEPYFSDGTSTIKWLDENRVQVDYINNRIGHHATEIVVFN